MRSRRLAVLQAVVVAACVIVALYDVIGWPALYFVPAVLAFALLGRGHYVGEARLTTILRSARRRPRRRPAPAALRARPVPIRLLARGGRLIAEALAVRPPPAVSAG